MCGIAGIWNLDGKPVADEEIITFIDTLKHRGPDGRGVWHNTNKNLALAHRRLAIIDLSHEADQPLHDERYHIVFNGEIFNFIEIREELKHKGYTFKTDSDTEVILKAYHEWKEEMLFKFNGMWALLIYDESKEECFIARDRFGIKPFLYTYQNNQFAFASELKSFKALKGFDVRMNEDAATQFLRTGFGVESSTQTMMFGVEKLQAGHCGWITKNKKYIKRWWNTMEHLTTVPKTLHQQAEQFRELFYDSIKLRMRSDVSVGSSLSGGFDSSAVVSGLAEIGRQQLDGRQAKDWQQTFVATFPGKSNDERPQAEEVCNYAQVKGHFFEVDDAEALSLMDQVLYDFDDVYVGIPVAPWLIYRELRRSNIVVSLDGHGADELMGGYLHADGAFLSNAPSLIGHWKENKALLNAYFDYVGMSDVSDKKKQTLSMWLKFHPDFAAFRKYFGMAKEWKDQFLKPESQSYILSNTSHKIQSLHDELPDSWDETNCNLYRLFHQDVLPTILRNFDRMSMAHGIEVRMPFMDWRLVTYAFSLPGSSKIQNGFTKLVAREAMKGHMPESIRASRVKIGFNAPMPEWFSGPLKPWIHDLLSSSSVKQNQLVDTQKLQSELLLHEKNNDWNWSNTGNTWKYLHYLWFEKNFMKHE